MPLTYIFITVEFRYQNQFRFCSNTKSNNDIILLNDSEIIIQEHTVEDNIVAFPTEKELDLLTWKDWEYKFNSLKDIQNQEFQSWLIDYKPECHQLINKLVDGTECLYEEELEVLFLGAVNSGKSSIINAVKGELVAKVSQKRSKTQNMLRYKMGSHPESKYILVDSPGYGYTPAPLRVKKEFRKKIFQHVARSSTLLKIYLWISARAGIRDIDIDYLDQLDRFKRPIQIVLTKVDQRKSDLMTILTKTSMETQKYKSVLPTIHFTSVKDSIGIKDLQTNVALTFLKDY